MHNRLTKVISAICAGMYTFAQTAQAQIFNGGGIQQGVDAAGGITGVSGGSPREVIINIIATALEFTALLAVVMIIIAGFYLILSVGNEEGKEKAKKIIYYTIIGLLVILFSRMIVSLITVWLAGEI